MSDANRKAKILTNRTTVRDIVIRRIIDRQRWQDIAAEYDISVKALYLLRQRPIWREISSDVIREIDAEIEPKLRQCVLDIMESSDHKAAIQAARFAHELITGLPEHRMKMDVTVHHDLSHLSTADLAAIAEGRLPSRRADATTLELSDGIEYGDPMPDGGPVEDDDEQTDG